MKSKYTVAEQESTAFQLPVLHGCGGLRPGIDPTSSKAMLEAADEPSALIKPAQNARATRQRQSKQHS